jgi:MoxR-like ATPase
MSEAAVDIRDMDGREADFKDAGSAGRNAAPDDIRADGREADFKDAARTIRRIVDNIETVIIGKRPIVELVVLSLISGGHVLIEDVPGVGKTSLAASMAASVDCDFRRIQFTPDVMPSDVTGFSIFNQKTREFEYRAGAVLSNIVLADEINRASAKTQSSLLEAMEEHQITVDNQTYPLPEPFMVIATENPLESFGTYPLPEAQIDRFLIKTTIGYPEFSEECDVVRLGKSAKSDIRPVASGSDVLRARNATSHVQVSDAVVSYIVQIVSATRSNPDIQVGSSPRGSIALYKLSRAYALMSGRDYVIPDDVKYLVPFAIAHRLMLSHSAKLDGKDAHGVLRALLDSIAVPV